MRRALIIVKDEGAKAELRKALAGAALACSFTASNNGVREAIASSRPDVLLYEPDGQQPGMPELLRKIKQETNLPVIALVPEALLERTDFKCDADDFVVFPYDARELAIRVNRVAGQTADKESGEQIRCN